MICGTRTLLTINLKAKLCRQKVRGVVGALSTICDEAFLRKKLTVKTRKLFKEKGFLLDPCESPTYTSVRSGLQTRYY